MNSLYLSFSLFSFIFPFPGAEQHPLSGCFSSKLVKRENVSSSPGVSREREYLPGFILFLFSYFIPFPCLEPLPFFVLAFIQKKSKKKKIIQFRWVRLITLFTNKMMRYSQVLIASVKFFFFTYKNIYKWYFIYFNGVFFFSGNLTSSRFFFFYIYMFTFNILWVYGKLPCLAKLSRIENRTQSFEEIKIKCSQF